MAVSDAVAAFLIPDGTGVDVPLLDCGVTVPFSASRAFVLSNKASWVAPFVAGAFPSVDTASTSPFFFRFLLPGAFFYECVSPVSFNLFALATNFSISSFASGSIVIMLSDV